jgi:hypothetical protein
MHLGGATRDHATDMVAHRVADEEEGRHGVERNE